MSFSSLDNWFVTDNVSEDNLVTPLIDGKVALDEIIDSIDDLQGGDFCFFGAWAFHGSFKRSATEPDSEQLYHKLRAALQRGASVRLLLFRGQPNRWDFLSEILGMSSFASGPTIVQLHLFCLNLAQDGGEVIIDTIHPEPWGSHHHKYAIFGTADGAQRYFLKAFCGGIDPVSDRYDDANHMQSHAFGYGWHDVHAKVEGPAAVTIWQDFVNRWNAHPSVASGVKTATTTIDPAQYTFVTAPTTSTHRVEVLNTYACPDALQLPLRGLYYPFAPMRTIEEAYLNGIRQANHYLYIENLFFLYEPISEAIAARLGENGSLQVIVVVDYLGGLLSTDRYWQNEVLTPLLRSPHADRVYICDLRHPDAGYDWSVAGAYDDAAYSEPIYVHSKVMIVDDVYATIGSANLCPRSMTYDSEINIGFVDGVQTVYEVNSTQYAISPAVRDFRADLWKEHLQLSDMERNQLLLEIPTALDAWRDRITYASRSLPFANKTPSRVFHHDPQQMGPPLNEPLFYWGVAHPTDRC